MQQKKVLKNRQTDYGRRFDGYQGSENGPQGAQNIDSGFLLREILPANFRWGADNAAVDFYRYFLIASAHFQLLGMNNEVLQPNDHLFGPSGLDKMTFKTAHRVQSKMPLMPEFQSNAFGNALAHQALQAVDHEGKSGTQKPIVVRGVDQYTNAYCDQTLPYPDDQTNYQNFQERVDVLQLLPIYQKFGHDLANLLGQETYEKLTIDDLSRIDTIVQGNASRLFSVANDFDPRERIWGLKNNFHYDGSELYSLGIDCLKLMDFEHTPENERQGTNGKKKIGPHEDHPNDKSSVAAQGNAGKTKSMARIEHMRKGIVNLMKIDLQTTFRHSGGSGYFTDEELKTEIELKNLRR